MLTVNMTYEVKNKIDETRTAKALGSEGGSLAFNGKITIPEFADNASRGEINFVGTGTKAQQQGQPKYSGSCFHGSK